MAVAAVAAGLCAADVLWSAPGTRERVRIAREFHDVVAHTVAAVSVQMGVVAAAYDRNPETARSALRQARAAGRDAMAELRGVVRLLREDPGGSPAGPSPELDRLDDLVAGVRQAGVKVVLERQDCGEVRPEPSWPRPGSCKRR